MTVETRGSVALSALDRPIRTVHLVSVLRSAGPTHQLLYILKHMDRQMFSPIVVTLSPEEEPSSLPSFLDLNIAVRSISLGRVEGAFRAGSQVARLVADIAPDVIHSQGIRADHISARRLRQYPRLATLRNDPFEDYPAKFGTLRGRLAAAAHVRSLGRIDTLVACSESIGQICRQRGFSPRTIQNGTDVERFRPPSPAERTGSRALLGVADGRTIIVSVGALGVRKNPLTLIRAFRQSPTARDALLVLVGDGPLRRRCEEAVGGVSNIVFAGQVPDVMPYLWAADLFISTSSSEGLPNAVIEALATGVPAVLSQIPQHEEILQRERNAGTLVPGQDYLAIAAVLDEWANSATLGARRAAARRLAVGHFSSERMSGEYQDLFVELATVEDSDGSRRATSSPTR